jgi:hypothetical protein
MLGTESAGEQKESSYHSGLAQEVLTITCVRPANHTVALIEAFCAQFCLAFQVLSASPKQ